MRTPKFGMARARGRERERAEPKTIKGETDGSHWASGAYFCWSGQLIWESAKTKIVKIAPLSSSELRRRTDSQWKRFFFETN